MHATTARSRVTAAIPFPALLVGGEGDAPPPGGDVSCTVVFAEKVWLRWSAHTRGGVVAAIEAGTTESLGAARAYPASDVVVGVASRFGDATASRMSAGPS